MENVENSNNEINININDKNNKKKTRKKLMIIILSTVLILAILLLFIGNYFFNFALNKKVDKSKVFNANKGGVKNEKLEEDKIWFDKVGKTVNIYSVQNLRLNGSIFYANNKEKEKNKDTKNNWIIVIHGYNGESRKMATYVKKLVGNGYNVLAIDLIAHGKSEGNIISMGGFDSKDLVNWIGYLNSNEKPDNIVIYGVSMGAATVLNTLDENLPKNVCGYIEDSGYLNLKQQFAYQLKKMYKLPSFPIIDASSIVTKIRGGYYFNEVDAKKGLSNTNLYGLLIHGTKDTFVPFNNITEIEEILKKNNRKYKKQIFEGTKHCEAQNVYETEYWNTIFKYLKEVYNNK